MNIVLYLRVSAGEQARKDYSIPAQRDHLPAFAQARTGLWSASTPTRDLRYQA
jgi:DNA invertase Pin-like site-specific DNA recombinase